MSGEALMAARPPAHGRRRSPVANAVRDHLDDVDAEVVRLLLADARTPNNAVARAVGVAPSTALARTAALRERGVLTGARAEVDPGRVGLGLRALVSVRLGTHDAADMQAFVARLQALPGVVDVFFLAGRDDYLVHLVAPSSDALRELVLEHLSSHPLVQHTETSLVFEHRAGTDVLGLGSAGRPS
ncbi:Lrp/AsnC family transcriptional regulator [uncultured Pseudokineococcus sp.]|uniref:Lrp/AsnC family transcriptional regulator n=1 Tax=uncultured Pseudokineococcus sp. TaxID=1642928 RepID=UPI0026314611|nr:Lrp/AsnC family transcriptional regulator [uncultured Pseudokineococcus sp.]